MMLLIHSSSLFMMLLVNSLQGNGCGEPYAGTTVDPQHCNGCQMNVNPNMYTIYARRKHTQAPRYLCLLWMYQWLSVPVCDCVALHDGSVAVGMLNRQRAPTPPPPPLPKGLKPFLKGKLCVDQGEILGSAREQVRNRPKSA